jgi:hypothetical protein
VELAILLEELDKHIHVRACPQQKSMNWQLHDKVPAASNVNQLINTWYMDLRTHFKDQPWTGFKSTLSIMFGFDQAQNTLDQHPRMEWNEMKFNVNCFRHQYWECQNMSGTPTLGEKPCMQIINLNHQKQDDNQ